LAYLAETTNLLHPTQIGGRLKKSAIDAALLLTTEIESNKRQKRKTTTLLLDVKGAFDHVAKNQLLAILKRLRLPVNLISWISSFLDDRQLRLSFDGQIEEFSLIDTGIPQGSLVSPILFLIYIRELFQSSSVRYLSYMDDISMTVSSTSFRKNVEILEREATKLYELGAQNAIQFDLAKTELIHFAKCADAKGALNLPNGETIQPKVKCVDTKCALILPNGVIIQPKELVRWLGVWYDSGLTFKQHVAIRTSQARSAF
jgi:Reverse transcriptase (RNA-dependent DNA polymerase)